MSRDLMSKKKLAPCTQYRCTTQCGSIYNLGCSSECFLLSLSLYLLCGVGAKGLSTERECCVLTIEDMYLKG